MGPDSDPAATASLVARAVAASPTPAARSTAARPALALPEGLVGLALPGALEARDRTGALRWKVPCRRAALVVFGEVACADGAHARIYRADGKLMAETAFPGEVAGALATQEWLFAVTRAPDGRFALHGAARVPLPPR